MKTLTFAAAITMATALHADDELLSGLGPVSGPNDVTALIVMERPRLPLPRLYRYAQECKPPPEPGLFIRERRYSEGVRQARNLR